VADLFTGLVDIGMSYDGDLMVDEDGDLAKVEGFDWLCREVSKRIRTENPEWVGHPTIGANLGDFIGQPNTAGMAKIIRKRVKHTISKGNIAFPGEFSVRVVPIRRDAIMIMIYLNLAGHRTELEKVIYSFGRGVVESVEESSIVYRPVPREAKLLDIEVNQGESSPNRYIEAIQNQY